jgi:uncharacterized membrane protein
MKLEIIKYLREADQTICPLISLEVACNMTTHEEIRRFPSKYERLSCKKILNFVGDNPNIMLYDPYNDKDYPLNVLIFNMIDQGKTLKQIGDYLEITNGYLEN